MLTLPSSGLYIITPEHSKETVHEHALLTAVEHALQGGAAVVQYRDKSLDHERRYRVAKRLVELCQNYQVPLIVNDDVALAKRINASGVHLGQGDASINAARQALGPQSIVGVSCYNRLDLARQAQNQGADYVAFGRFFPSRTKPDAVTAPLSLLAEAKEKIHCPIVAIGGITLNNGQALIAQGANFLAVVQGIFSAPDITETSALFKQQFIKQCSL